MTRVTLTGLRLTYGAVTAVDDLSLEIAPGQITALLGPSGCGKTSTLKLIAGLLTPTAGEVAFDGRPMQAVPAERRGAVMVFQNGLLFPYMSVAENVGFGLRMRGAAPATIRTQVTHMLAQVQLAGYEARRPHELSGGQQQRVALARALITEPRVLLLDEPLSSLDAHLRDDMRALILTLQRQRAITTVVVTHDQTEAVLLADRIALLNAGALQQYAPPRAFYEQPASEWVARFFGGANFLPGAKQGERVRTAQGEFRLGAGAAPDGPVTLTLRPEAVQWASAAQTENVLTATLEARVYAGTHSRLKWRAGAALLEMVVEAHQAEDLPPGAAARLYLPPERLWAMRGED